MRKHPHFASHKVVHVLTGHSEEGGCHVMGDKTYTSSPWWMKNTWMEHIGVRMSQGRIVIADSLLGGRIVWIKMSPVQFVGG